MRKEATEVGHAKFLSHLGPHTVQLVQLNHWTSMPQILSPRMLPLLHRTLLLPHRTLLLPPHTLLLPPHTLLLPHHILLLPPHILLLPHHTVQLVQLNHWTSMPQILSPLQLNHWTSMPQILSPTFLLRLHSPPLSLHTVLCHHLTRPLILMKLYLVVVKGRIPNSKLIAGGN